MKATSINCIYDMANDLCNEIDSAMMLVVPALADYPCRGEFNGVGELQKAWEFTSKARVHLTEAVKSLDTSSVILTAFSLKVGEGE